MTRRLGAAGVVSMALAVALTMAAVLLGASTARAEPTTVPLAFDFTGLFPGESRTESHTYRLDRDVRVVSVDVGTTAGASWTAQLCRDASCADVLAMRSGDEFGAGDYDLRVGVTVTSLQPGAISAVTGRLSFVEAETGGLALTGADPLAISLAALATTAIGLLLLAAARRRRGDDEPPATRAADI